jgi:serine/threonine-protein kinase
MSTGSNSPLIATGAMVAAKYRLDALIGEGGMGSVWSATHLGLGQAVAIKFISRDFVKSEEALRRFDAEAKAAAQLRSRHVVQVFDTGTLDDGTPYISMELLSGESLQGRIHRGGPVQLAEAVDILAQACKGLGRAHAAGIIHRDIKPDNIFLAQSNDDDHALVKILDFGVAKMGGNANEQGSQGATRTGAVLGTPLYMSPEQARGLKTIDQRTDLYSLGLVAYTMFTGNLAFSSESFGDLLLQICTAPLPSLAAGAPWLPPGVELWFQKACAREPTDRYGSAQEFIDGLRTAAGITLSPNRDASREMAAVSGMGAMGSPSGMGSMGGPVLATTAGGPAGATSPGITRSGVADDYVPPGAGKKSMGLIAGGVVAVLVAVGAAVMVVGKGKQPDPAAGAATAAPPAADTASHAATPNASASANAALTPLPAGSAAASASATASSAPPQHASAEHETHSAAGAATHGALPAGGKPAPTATGAAHPHSGSAAGAATVDLGY